MSEQVQAKYRESGWGWLLGQVTPVAEGILQHWRSTRGSQSSTTITAAATETSAANTIYTQTKPAGAPMSPLSPTEWINMMDEQGRFSPENAHELMRRAFYGVCSSSRRAAHITAARREVTCCVRRNRASPRTSAARLGSISCACTRSTPRPTSAQPSCATRRLFSWEPTTNTSTTMVMTLVAWGSADYHALKQQWQTMLPEQLKRCTKFVNTRAQIGLLLAAPTLRDSRCCCDARWWGEVRQTRTLSAQTETTFTSRTRGAWTCCGSCC